MQPHKDISNQKRKKSFTAEKYQSPKDIAEDEHLQQRAQIYL